MIALEQIRAARDRIATVVHRTPQLASAALSRRLGAPVAVKYELFQKTGSFKARGAFNKVLGLSVAQRGRGLVAVSGGNHAQGVAYAAQSLGLSAVILMPAATPAHYLEATRAYGAEVRLVPSTLEGLRQIEDYVRDGWAFIHPFDDPEVMAGAGTVGLEIFEDDPRVTDVVVSIGGGGFAGGVASALKQLAPAVRVWGVETEGADCMSRSLAAGTIVTIEKITSVAKTLGAPAPSARTLGLARDLLESVTVVSDGEALEAQRYLLQRLKVIAEPAASCTLAAADRLKARFSADSRVVLILCGGNDNPWTAA